MTEIKYDVKEKELYLKIFEEFPALIWRSGLDKLCNYFNNTWLEFTGRTMEQEYGNGWAEGVHPDDFEGCLQTYVTSFDKREPFEMEYRLKNKHGEYRWIRDYGRPFSDLDNTFLGYIGSCYDITDSKRNEEELININSTKDKFFSILAHDLRTPFSGFLGLTEDLVKNADKMQAKEISEYAEAMNASASKIFGLLNNLLEWSGLHTGRIEFIPEEINLFVEVADTTDILFSAAECKSIKIINEIDPEKKVFADRKMLSTVLRNLVSNAIKFTRPEGIVSIHSKPAGEFVEISVSDTGIGIPREQIESLFRIDRSISTKGTNGEQGTGLGLMLCKELVGKNNGEIRINSLQGEGTTVSFTLPSSKE